MMQRNAWQRWPAEWVVLASRYSGGLAWARALLLKYAVIGMGAVFVYWAGWPEPSLPDHPMTSFPQKSGDISRTMPGLAPEVLEDDFVRRKEYGSAPQPVASEKEDRPKKNSFMLDLNDGTLEEFKHLPGIGAILAGRIIAHRASHGAFGHVDDLVLVPGIGKKRLEQLRSFVGVRASDKG